MPKEFIVAETVEAFKVELTEAGIINPKNDELTKNAADILYYEFKNPTLKTFEIKIKERFIDNMQNKGSRRIEIKNGDEEPVVNGYHSFVTKSEFQKLWIELKNRIVKRTMYQIKIDNEQFIKECIDDLNEKSSYKVLKREFEVATGKGDYDESRKFKFDDPAKVSLALGDEDIEIIKSDFEITNYLMHYTMLPRKALFRIISGLKNKKFLQKQAVLDEVMKAMLDKLTEFNAKNIDYEVIDRYLFEESSIFSVEEIERSMVDNKRAYKTKRDYKRTLHKYIRVDSDGEFKFAKSLDEDPDVLLFTKLKKGGIVIDNPYGTGKTTLLSILCSQKDIAAGGVLLLAPTGKARVRVEEVIKELGKKLTGNIDIKACTLAQHLGKSKRFDYRTQQYKLSDRPAEDAPRTVIIDESSMLTEEMLAALIQSLKGVHRLILVGDPSQLPPIGPGRPFVDIVAKLKPSNIETIFPKVAQGYGELTIHR